MDMACLSDDDPLRAALIAKDCPPLALPPSSSFEEHQEPTDTFAVRQVHIFEAHHFTRLQCDKLCHELGGHIEGKHHEVHCFTLLNQLATTINAALHDLAIEQEQLGSGVAKTNVGGFQSRHDLFEAKVADAHLEIRRLHMVASAALGELGIERVYPDQRSRPRMGEPHPAYAWLNVNRASDYNALHVHARDRWSAVYFVAAGEYGPGGQRGGTLVLRGGGERGCTHTYMPIHPEPGRLWLFSGSIPHTVLGAAGEPQGVQRAAHGRARISVAINFVDARSFDPL
jgi:hypothetical protein